MLHDDKQAEDSNFANFQLEKHEYFKHRIKPLQLIQGRHFSHFHGGGQTLAQLEETVLCF